MARPVRHGVGRIRRVQRILREQMLDVGKHQFLVLLFVLQAQFDQRGERLVDAAGQQVGNAAVDIRAVVPDDTHARSGQEPPLGARVLVAHAVVVRVEEHPERRMKRREIDFARLENEGFKEPRRMRQVPFHRARIRHRLRAAVFVGQTLGQLQRTGTYLRKGAWQAVVAHHVHDAIAWA
jgi:hypothetical protein